MSAAEFDMWMIRAAITPFTAQRLEAGIAQIAMLIYNTNVKKDKQKKLEDFLLFRAAQKVDDKVLDVFGKLGATRKPK